MVDETEALGSEELCSIVYESEAITNKRLLTYISENDEELEAL